jgi:hypothetical protein
MDTKQTRRHQVMVRFTDEERAAVQTAAELCRLTVAAYVRACALGQTPKPQPKDTTERATLTNELARIGNNFLQCARHEEGQAREALEEIAATFGEVLPARLWQGRYAADKAAASLERLRELGQTLNGLAKAANASGNLDYTAVQQVAEALDRLAGVLFPTAAGE